MNGLSRCSCSSVHAINLFPAQEGIAYGCTCVRLRLMFHRDRSKLKEDNVLEHSTQGQSGFTTHLDNTSHILPNLLPVVISDSQGLFRTHTSDDRVYVCEGEIMLQFTFY